MRLRLIAANLAAAIVTALPAHSARAMQAERSTDPSERRIPVGNASLYARVIGRGQPVIVLHGGPDFDHGYLLPDLDRLKDAFRLIYYDRLGRGAGPGVRISPPDPRLSPDSDEPRAGLH